LQRPSFQFVCIEFSLSRRDSERWVQMKARFFLLSDSSSMFESMCRLRAWWGSAAKTCMLLSNGILFSEDRRDK